MGKIVKRLDILKRDQLEFTQQGFLKMPVFAGRTGIQEYFDEDGNVLREYRPADEVFSEKTMASLTMIPITNDHPRKMVDANNARVHTVGFTGEHAQKVDDKFLKTTAVIFDEETIEEIRNGKVEVSLGYDVDLDETPGVFDGEKYDVVQRNIVNNHLAIVDKGRAGAEVRLRLDSGEAVLKNGSAITIIKKEDSEMGLVKIGDKEFELNEEVATAVKDLLEENEKLKKGKDAADPEEEAKKKAEDEEAEKKKAEDEEAEAKKKEEDEAGEGKKENSDTLQAKIDALQADNKKLKEGQMDAKQIDRIARQRTKVLSVGEQVLDSETSDKMESMDTCDIKKAIVEAESDEKMDGKSEDYIDARFDHISSTIGKSDKANSKVSKSVSDSRMKAQVADAAEKRKANMKKDSERWQEPIGKHSLTKAN